MTSMNISSSSSTKDSNTAAKVETPREETNKKTEETKPVNKAESSEKKEDAKGKDSSFKKLLEPQNTDKMILEGQNQQFNQNSLENIANKFSFDVGGLTSKKFGGEFEFSMNYNTANISKDDAKFFSDLVENKQFAVGEANGKTNLIKFTDEIGPTYKTQQTSKILANLIEKAYNEQKPVRLDFDNNVSVIMKIDKSGKVSAEFIPGDKAVEEYLRNNIRSLKQRFDDENLPYNDLFYRQSGNKNQQQQRKNKGE